MYSDIYGRCILQLQSINTPSTYLYMILPSPSPHPPLSLPAHVHVFLCTHECVRACGHAGVRACMQVVCVCSCMCVYLSSSSKTRDSPPPLHIIRQNITKYSALASITVAMFFIAMAALVQMSQGAQPMCTSSGQRHGGQHEDVD